MADAPNNEDKRLPDRLNALKPSSVQLERQKNVVLNTTPSITTSSITPFSTFNNSLDLEPAVPRSKSKLDDLATGSLFADDDILSSEAILDGDAIEDLLASLDTNNNNDKSANTTSRLSDKQENDDKNKTRELLSNAYGFIQQTTLGPEEDEITRSSHDTNKSGTGEEDIPSFLKSYDNSDNEEGQSSSDEEKDEAEAEKYVENLLKEIQTAPADDVSSPSPLTGPEEDDNNNDSDDKKNGDDDLSTRLAALSLPSVPDGQPGQSAQARHGRKNESPECCCICYDTAKLKCTDCEGDQLFCVRCWWEMHMGDDGGGFGGHHKAVQYGASS